MAEIAKRVAARWVAAALDLGDAEKATEALIDSTDAMGGGPSRFRLLDALDERFPKAGRLVEKLRDLSDSLFTLNDELVNYDFVTGDMSESEKDRYNHDSRRKKQRLETEIQQTMRALYRG